MKTKGETEARRTEVLPEAVGKEEERGGASAQKLPTQLLPGPERGRPGTMWAGSGGHQQATAQEGSTGQTLGLEAQH